MVAEGTKNLFLNKYFDFYMAQTNVTNKHNYYYVFYFDVLNTISYYKEKSYIIPQQKTGSCTFTSIINFLLYVSSKSSNATDNNNYEIEMFYKWYKSCAEIMAEEISKNIIKYEKYIPFYQNILYSYKKYYRTQNLEELYEKYNKNYQVNYINNINFSMLVSSNKNKQIDIVNIAEYDKINKILDNIIANPGIFSKSDMTSPFIIFANMPIATLTDFSADQIELFDLKLNILNKFKKAIISVYKFVKSNNLKFNNVIINDINRSDYGWTIDEKTIESTDPRIANITIFIFVCVNKLLLHTSMLPYVILLVLLLPIQSYLNIKSSDRQNYVIYNDKTDILKSIKILSDQDIIDYKYLLSEYKTYDDAFFGYNKSASMLYSFYLDDISEKNGLWQMFIDSPNIGNVKSTYGFYGVNPIKTVEFLPYFELIFSHEKDDILDFLEPQTSETSIVTDIDFFPITNSLLNIEYKIKIYISKLIYLLNSIVMTDNLYLYSHLIIIANYFIRFPSLLSSEQINILKNKMNMDIQTKLLIYNTIANVENISFGNYDYYLTDSCQSRITLRRCTAASSSCMSVLYR